MTIVLATCDRRSLGLGDDRAARKAPPPILHSGHVQHSCPPHHARSYIGSGTDGGHSGEDCTPGVNADGTYNLEFIENFFRVGTKQQILWSKKLAHTYYSKQPAFNYWNGCSTGGRQGYLLAQELGDELDGVLANAPAIFWTRFETAQMWGQLAMHDFGGERPPASIVTAKLQAVQQAAIAACDAKDGVVAQR
jgi:hypothetical protein